MSQRESILVFQHRDWGSIPVERVAPGIERQMIWGERVMVCRLKLAPHTVTPVHSHPHEQITLVEKGPVRFSIAWPDLTRAIEAPASALSATVTVSNGAAMGGDLVASVDRNAGTAGYTQEYASASPGRTGTFPMTIRFYDQAAGSGSVVGVGQATVTIAANGSGIGNIAIANTITSVTVPAGQTVPFGGEAQLLFTARDANNAIVAVTPGSGHWELVGTTQAFSLTADGAATALLSGTGEVRVTVDGITSDAATVTVLSPPDFLDPSFEMLPLTAGQWKRNIDVTGIPWSGNDNWGVANAFGSWGMGGANSTSQYAFIQAGENFGSHGALKQSISGLVIGQHYRVSLWIARRNGNVGGNVGALVTVFANGVKIMDDTSPTTTGSYRKVTTDTFIATQSSYEFIIETVLPQFPEDQATLVDDVHLELAP